MNAPIPTPSIVRELDLGDLGGCAALITRLITAYDDLPTHLSVALGAQLDGNLNVPQTHDLAGRLLDEVPMDQMQLILTRLLCMADERPMHGGFPADVSVDIDLTLPTN